MHRRPRPDRKCRPVLANPRWFGMRYRRTEAAGPRGSVTVLTAAAAAVVAVFVVVVGRHSLAAAARTPRRHCWWRCPAKAGWRPGGPPPWPAWPWSWLGALWADQNDERIRMFVGDLQLNLAGPANKQTRRRLLVSFVVATERRFRDQIGHLTSKPRNRRTKARHSNMC